MRRTKNSQDNLIAAYHLAENLFRARVPQKSFLIGKPLSQNSLLAGIFIVTALLTQAVTGAVAAAVIAPLANRVTRQANINPRSLAMGAALATSTAFITPLGHPVNIPVMSPGDGNFRDYLKVGVPPSIILFGVVMIFLPLFWTL